MITRARRYERKAFGQVGKALLAVLLGASAAQAETLLTPFAGAVFKGSSRGTPGTYGGALGFLGAGVAGFELEFATSPDFFGTANDGDVFTKNNVVTMMGNLILASAGAVRVYATVGLGLLKTRLEDADNLLHVDSNDFGFNGGAGLILFVGDHVGLRGDIRYFRDLADNQPDREFDIDLGQLDYWRAVGGITLRF